MSAGREGGQPAWHVLLGPLPTGPSPRGAPVVSPERDAGPDVAAIAGWESVVLELSAGAAGLRVIHVLLDAEGRPLSASDHVVYRAESEGQPGTVHTRQESIGGRFESDGEFRGTCWLVTGPEPVDEEAPRWDMTPREPTQGEAEALRQIVVEVVRRWREA